MPIQSSSHSLSAFPPSMQLYSFIQLLLGNATVRKRSFDLLLDASMICVWIYSSLEFTVPTASYLSYHDVYTYVCVYIYIYINLYKYVYINLNVYRQRGKKEQR